MPSTACSVDEADPHALRSRIALVPQEVALFDDTILENIRYGRPERQREDVAQGRRCRAGRRVHCRSAARLCHPARRARSHAVRRAAPAHSAGARGAARCADPPARRGHQRARCGKRGCRAAGPGRIMQNRTTLVIAHRLATVQRASRILVLDRGGSSRKAATPICCAGAACMRGLPTCSSRWRRPNRRSRARVRFAPPPQAGGLTSRSFGFSLDAPITAGCGRFGRTDWGMRMGHQRHGVKAGMLLLGAGRRLACLIVPPAEAQAAE